MVDIYLSSVSPNGLHQCVIDGHGQSVWMYLYDLQQVIVLSDSPLCSLVVPITIDEFKKTYQRGDTPPFVIEYSSDRATIPGMVNDRLGIVWGNDGVSVVASIDEEPFSMIIKNEKTGYSKSIIQPCPWGNPWDETIYLKHFG